MSKARIRIYLEAEVDLPAYPGNSPEVTRSNLFGFLNSALPVRSLCRVADALAEPRNPELQKELLNVLRQEAVLAKALMDSARIEVTSIPSIAEVGGITLFTKLLDGGGPVQCACGHIWRFVPDASHDQAKGCPACGRSVESSHDCSMDEYKNSRKENT